MVKFAEVIENVRERPCVLLACENGSEQCVLFNSFLVCYSNGISFSCSCSDSETSSPSSQKDVRISKG